MRVAAREQEILVVMAAVPNRADGVNHPLCFEYVPTRDLRVAGRASLELAALLEKFRPRGAVNGAVHPASSQQRSIRRVYDRVHVLSGDIALNDFDGGGGHVDDLPGNNGAGGNANRRRRVLRKTSACQTASSGKSARSAQRLALYSARHWRAAQSPRHRRSLQY